HYRRCKPAGVKGAGQCEAALLWGAGDGQRKWRNEASDILIGDSGLKGSGIVTGEVDSSQHLAPVLAFGSQRPCQRRGVPCRTRPSLCGSPEELARSQLGFTCEWKKRNTFMWSDTIHHLRINR